MYKTLIILLMTIIPLPVFAGEGFFFDSPEEAFSLSEKTGQNLLLIFGADYCKYCNIMKKDILDHADLFDNIIVCYVDIEQRGDLKKEYSVKTIPDYMIYAKGTETKRKIGYPGFDQFKTWLAR